MVDEYVFDAPRSGRPRKTAHDQADEDGHIIEDIGNGNMELNGEEHRPLSALAIPHDLKLTL